MELLVLDYGYDDDNEHMYSTDARERRPATERHLKGTKRPDDDDEDILLTLS